MVKDHQKSVCPESVGQMTSTRQRWRRVPSGENSLGKQHAPGANSSHAWGSAGHFDRSRQIRCGFTWSALVLFVCSGCQSGLVDPGRSRGASRPSQSISPPLMVPQPTPGQQQTIDGLPAATGSNHPDWGHVTRQPVSNVVQLSPNADAKPQYHTVQPGESWSSLAKQHGLTVKQLADANGIDPGAILKKGQIVYIPESGRRAESP